MAVTQYIGSRYVPLFADPIDWSNQNTYEPLTIVLHGGNSYTSKQAVPKGIDISNEEFWALTGNYNAQVESYRNEVMQYSELTQRVSESLPSNAFSQDNTVKDYIDDAVEAIELSTDNIEKNITSIELENENCISYAKLAYRNVEFLGTASGARPFRQGMTIFPLGGNWESKTLYAASAINPGGTDTNISIEIINLSTRSVVSTIDVIGESESQAVITHGGCLFTDGTILYVPIYTNSSESAKRLRKYSILNPTAPVYIDELTYGNTPIAVPFAKFEDGFLGYGTPRNENMSQGIYTWDGENSYTWLFDVNPTASGLGKRPQPYSYDSVYNVIIVPFADCAGYLMYDLNGNIVGHKAINNEIGFVNVGELETVFKHGQQVWFAGFYNTGLGTIFSYGIWNWSNLENGPSIAPQGRASSGAYNIRLNPTSTKYPLESSYSTNQTIELAVPDDAVNMARYLSSFKGTNIFQTADYNCCIVIGNYTGRFSANGHFATNGYFIYNFNGIIHGLFNFSNADPTKFLSDLQGGWSVNGYFSDCGLPVAVVIMSCNITFTTASGTYAHDETFYKFRFMSSNVRVACTPSNIYLTDCVFEKCEVVGARQPRLHYAKLALSTFLTLTVSLGTFDAEVYTIDVGVSFLGCFITDGTEGGSSSALLPNKQYYVGGLATVNNVWHFLPIANNTRLMTVSDRLHSSDLVYVYNSNNVVAMAKVTMRVASNMLTLTTDNENVTSFNVWT